MKLMFASLFAALFALAATAGYAALPSAGAVVYGTDTTDSETTSGTPSTEQKDEDDDKKKEDDKS